MPKIVLDKVAYVRHPVLPELKRKLNSEGFQIIDSAFAPEGETIVDGTGNVADGLRSDGPTVVEYVARGYLAVNYPPEGYASRSTDQEIEDAIAAQKADTPLKVAQVAGGKWFVKQGRKNFKGPFGTEAEAEAAMLAPDGVPTPIPEAWEAMTDEELVKLAGELAGEPVTELNGQTPAERARSIIQAAVDDRAGRNG